MSVNRLFVAYKPPFIGSNRFLGRLKKRYGADRGGFSGTLDPFAKGVLLVAFGQYTRLFNYLSKTPKTYRAVLWLGAHSKTLDVEQITRVENTPLLDADRIKAAMNELVGVITQTPPAFSALRVDGARAYHLARNGEEFCLPRRQIRVDRMELIAYCHPFITFECAVCEGAYVRSLGQDLARKLGCAGALSFLERASEGRFIYEGEKALDPLRFIDLKRNRFLGKARDLFDAKKCLASDFEQSDEGDYLVESQGFFVIIRIQNGRSAYLLGHTATFGN
ncbi:MAG: tRNA pseudouridine(55) synthase TruB [Helicobacteraceae bacterium]|nr:tRNA pseudouridine(55) synthase TruB [Helicobacteraceae bacterium]